MLTWRKQQRLYFGLGVKDALTAQDALTWFLKIEPLNTTLPNDTSTEFTRSSLSNFPPCNLTADECRSLYLLIRICYPWPRHVTDCQTKVNVFAQGQKFIKEKEKAHSAWHGQWMKMEITSTQCCWPQSLRHIHSSFHPHISALILCVFTPNQ